MVTWLSIIGVALGVMSLVGGFSMTRGFEVAFRDKVLGVTAHVFVREYGIRFGRYREVADEVRQVPGVKALAPMTFSEVMITGADANAGAIVKGIVPDRVGAVLAIDDYMVEGSLDALGGRSRAGLDGVILGAELADRLGVKTGDAITMVSPLRSRDPDDWSAQPTSPTTRTFEVRGVFRAGFFEYDNRLAYMELSVAQDYFRMGDVVTGLEVAVDDPFQAGVVADIIRGKLGADAFSVLDWRRQNRNLFRSLADQRLAIVLVLSVMVVLASCLVACTLVMLVLVRTRDIAILKTMGATNFSVLVIFVTEGILIGTVGTGIGLVGAYGLFEGLLAHGIALDAEVYGIARLPVVFDPLDYAQAGIGAVLITFVAAIFPALRGARLHPVVGLRELN